MFGLTVKGDYEGQEVALWASIFSGLEVISVAGREVSRKRSFRFSTNHDLSATGLHADLGVVKMPCTLELHRQGHLVARFKHPTAMLALILVSVLVGCTAGVIDWLFLRR